MKRLTRKNGHNNETSQVISRPDSSAPIKETKMSKTSKIQQCYERAKEIRHALLQNGRLMEVNEDRKYGILWERYVLKKDSLVLFATPDYWELFKPIFSDGHIHSYNEYLEFIQSYS